MAADGFQSDQAGVQQEQQQQQQHTEDSPLQNYFTLPFALHLRPLPHVSYFAQEDSQESSDAEQRDSASIISSESNYRAGRHRLKPVVQSVSPHSLSTISILLEHTRCLEAVPLWTRLIAMLEAVEDDAHFTTLRQFFDTRFDADGRMISDKTKEGINEDEKDSSALWGSTGIFRRRTSSIARRSSRTQNGRSPLIGTEEGARRESNTSRSSGRPFVVRSKSRLGNSINAEGQAVLDEEEEEGASSVGGEEIRSQPSNMSPPRIDRGQSQRKRLRAQSLQQKLIAPEINVVRRIVQQGGEGNARPRAASIRPVRFKIRLDLHAVHLAPRPPRIPSTIHRSTSQLGSRSQRGYARQQQGRMASSPEKGLEIYRVTSIGGSSAHSIADGVGLHRVISPDSVRSQQMSEESHSDDLHRNRSATQSEALSTSPPRRGTNLSKQSSTSRKSFKGRTMTGSSAATNLTSLFGSSPEVGDDSREVSLKTMASNGKEDDKRRPSIIQRLFSGRKGSSGRKRSVTSSTNLSNASMEDVQSIPEQDEAVKERNLQTLPSGLAEVSSITSPTSLDGSQSRSFSMAMNSQDTFGRRLRGRTNETSDWSNEEALDTADDEGSVGSSSGWGKIPTGRRKSSSGVLPSNTAALKPVDEERVFDSISAFSGNFHDDEDIAEENEDEAEWSHKDDFLSLFRLAAQTTLQFKEDRPEFSTNSNVMSPKSPSSVDGMLSPPGSIHMEEKLRAEELLAPFLKKGLEENPDSWWLCGKADPLPISFACALSQALGWQGVMKLCYGKDSRCEKAGTFYSLGKAAEMHGKLQDDSDKVRDWAQSVVQSSLPVDAPDTFHEEDQPDRTIESLEQDSEVAPSESASTGRVPESKGKSSKLAKWMNKISGSNVADDSDQVLSNVIPSLSIQDKVDHALKEGRTWQDWADLLASMAAWMEEYEMCRVRNGMAREIDSEPLQSYNNNKDDQRIDSGFVESESEEKKRKITEDKVVYSSKASYQVPRCVILDALEADHGYRRRHGIPEGLPVGPDGEEFGDYRWARSKLTSSHFATPLLLATSSLTYFFGQLASSDWTYNSSWELDYLEMCVFHSEIISKRFPSPNTSIVPFDQVYQPEKANVEAMKRAKTCPYPQASAWSANDWQEWLSTVQSGMILVPAVSWQAWWTLIAVLNGADGSGRALDLQVKAVEEPFSALDDIHCIYI